MMKHFTKIQPLMYVLWLLVFSPWCYAGTGKAPQDHPLFFAEANELFDQANAQALTNPADAQELYEKSILKYQFLVDEGGVESPGLHANLGNAYFLSGDHGRAVLNYQRALRLDPLQADASHNLQYVRTLTIDELPSTQTQKILQALSFWHRWSFTTRISLFALAHITLWILLASLFYRRSRWRYASIAATTLVSAVFAVSLWVSYQGWDNPVDGVVTDREVVARQGNGYIYDNAYSSSLHAGAEFSLIEQRGDWYHARLLDGTTCWLPIKSTELVNGPVNGLKRSPSTR